MANVRHAYPLLTLALVAGPLFAQAPTFAPEAVAKVRSQESLRVQQAASYILGQRSELGLNGLHSFKAAGSHTDEFGMTHAHFQQHYQGVRVWEGDVITHMDAAGNHRPHTDSLIRNINLSVTPTLSAAEAIAVAHANLAPKGAYANTPTSELVIFPEKQLTPKSDRAHHANAEDFEYQVTNTALAYHIHTELENAQETRHTDYMIDAHTGAILKTWSDLHTDSIGTANTQYSGTVSIHTTLSGSTYQLYDTYRSMNIKTYDLAHSTSSTSTGTLYTDADNTWGNSTNYTGSTTSTTSDTGQTAAVDAHYGIEMTYDFYKNVLGRSGIDNANKATYSRVHYSTSYDNAFWSDTCFCMTYGDGSSFKSLEAMDVAGHEMSHGVCANNGLGGLTYSGESGGINEADSDILGTFVTYYAYGAGGTGSTVPNTITTTHGYTPWTIGSQLSSTPLRYMYKPYLDGTSADYWYSGVGNLNVHYSSGPANRMMYFLSQGATTSGNTSTSTNSTNHASSPNFLPSGMTGIGNDHAARIWYRALTTYFTSSLTYAQCRTACLNAASDLYGTSSAEYAAVQNAFHGINVGDAASTPTALAISTNPTSQTVTAGTSVTFTVAVTGGTSPYTYQWYKNGTAVSGATSASYTFTAASTDSGATFYATVTDSATTQATVTSTTATLTISTGSTSYAEVESNGTIATANSVGDTVTTITGYIGSTSDLDYFKVKVNASTTLKVSMTGPSGKDYDLYLYNSSGTKLTSSTGTTATESISYTNSSTSAVYYYIKVLGYNKAYSTTTGYTLTLTR